MLEPLLAPQSIAVIGASRTPGKVGHELVANLIESKFAGTVVPVNPSADQILDLPCFPDLKSYGDTVDMTLIAVPTPVVKSSVEESIQAGARAIVIITAGFKEVGAEGADV